MSEIDTEINAAEEDWGRAFVGADTGLLERLIADDAIMFHGSGDVEDKAPFIANLFKRLDVQSLARTEIRIRHYGEIAIATCRQEMSVRLRASADGTFHQALANVTKVWIRRDGRWQMVSYHATRLAPAGR